MIGGTVGEYQIVRLIGRGGMGAVYEALQTKIGRRVALKILLPEYATNTELIERFFNETVAEISVGKS
jgi:serine/threonine protein kinase